MHGRLIDTNEIAKRRIALGMTVSELAKRAGVSRSTLKYINYHRRQSWDVTVGKIARALGCEVEDISTPRTDGAAA